MTTPASDTATVSVIIPVYSGEQFLERLVAELASIRAQWRDQGAPMRLAEVILVDDSAIDRSPTLIDQLAGQHDWIVPLHLSRNYGQHPATVAGILYSAGRWVVTMDEDLQHPPHRIIELLACAACQSADVVYAQPTRPVHGSRIRDLGSAGIKLCISRLTGIKHVRLINSFRLIRGEVARAVASVAIHDTYFDIELSFFTERIGNVPMPLADERYQRTGKSGYTLRSLISHAWRMIFSAHLRVLRFMTVLGAVTVGGSIILTLAMVVAKLTWPDTIAVRGWPSQMVAVMFFGGVNVSMVGIALQYLSTLVLRAHGRPTFFVIDRADDAELARFFQRQFP